MNLLKKGIGIVGSTTIDKIIAEDHRFLKLGGVTTYAGITYRRPGIPAFIISNLAELNLEIMAKLHAEDILLLSVSAGADFDFPLIITISRPSFHINNVIRWPCAAGGISIAR